MFQFKETPSTQQKPNEGIEGLFRFHMAEISTTTSSKCDLKGKGALKKQGVEVNIGYGIVPCSASYGYVFIAPQN